MKETIKNKKCLERFIYFLKASVRKHLKDYNQKHQLKYQKNK